MNRNSSQSYDNPIDRLKVWTMKNLLMVLTLVGVLLGLFFGCVLRVASPSVEVRMIIGFPGDVLLRMLKMLILPLIVASIITGLTQMDAKSNSKLGMRAVVYYLSTTIVANVIGTFLVLIIRPGAPFKRSQFGPGKELSKLTSLDTLFDVFRNFFPQNILQACFQKTKTEYTDGKHGLVYVDGMNILGILAFCIVFAILLNKMGQRGRIMVEFFTALNEIVMKMVNLAIWYSPVGIMSLICERILSTKDFVQDLTTLGLYVMTVLIGLFLHFCVLVIFFYVVTRRNPFRFFQGILQAWFTALATASSAGTLPVTFQCLEENNKVDPRITRFVLPIGATVNMDGTALYEAVAVIFIGQLNGIEMSLGKILIISVTSTLASIGAASIPSAGLVTMVVVLSAAGFPAEDVGLLSSVDWLLDRCRTSLNVLGDSFGAGIIEHLSRDDLDAGVDLDIGDDQSWNNLPTKNEKPEKDEHAL